MAAVAAVAGSPGQESRHPKRQTGHTLLVAAGRAAGDVLCVAAPDMAGVIFQERLERLQDIITAGLNHWRAYLYYHYE